MLVYEIVNGKLASLADEDAFPKKLKAKMKEMLKITKEPLPYDLREIKIIIKDGKKKTQAEIYVYGLACIHSQDKEKNALKGFVKKLPKEQRSALKSIEDKCVCVPLKGGGFWCT